MESPDDLVTCLDCKHFHYHPAATQVGLVGELECKGGFWRICFSGGSTADFRIFLKKAPSCKGFERYVEPRPQPQRASSENPTQVFTWEGEIGTPEET